MKEEKELIKAKQWYFEKKAKQVVSAINKNGMTGIYVKDKHTALNEILKLIPSGPSVSHGGSYTLRELGIIEKLEEGDYHYLRRNSEGRGPARDKIRMDGFASDIYLTSVNAITTKGELIVLDGSGNRAASICFGPKKVLVIAGKNKIVDSLEDGIKRVREFVAPIHVKRRGWDLPCAKSGKCVDCLDPKRICNKIAIIMRDRNPERMTVFLIGESLGI